MICTAFRALPPNPKQEEMHTSSKMGWDCGSSHCTCKHLCNEKVASQSHSNGALLWSMLECTVSRPLLLLPSYLSPCIFRKYWQIRCHGCALSPLTEEFDQRKLSPWHHSMIDCSNQLCAKLWSCCSGGWKNTLTRLSYTLPVSHYVFFPPKRLSHCNQQLGIPSYAC